MNDRFQNKHLDLDMSPEGVGRRLRTVGQLYRLGLSLQKARYVGVAEELKKLSPEERRKKFEEASEIVSEAGT
jgi:hypothetical protein